MRKIFQNSLSGRTFRGDYTFFICCIKPIITKFTFTAKQLIFFKQPDGVGFDGKIGHKNFTKFWNPFESFSTVQSQTQLNSLNRITKTT